jgi:hypothetical protein
MAQLVIGRLHRLECASGAEFSGFSVGENITAKVLKVSQGKSFPILKYDVDKNKTWIELTHRREHMVKPGNGLDSAGLAKTLFALEDLKAG